MPTGSVLIRVFEDSLSLALMESWSNCLNLPKKEEAMGNLVRLLFGRIDEEESTITGRHLPLGMRFLQFSEIKPWQKVVVKTVSGTIYRFRILDLKEGLVELLAGNARFFGQMPARCTYLGAASNNGQNIYPKMILEGACMVFSGVSSGVDGEDHPVSTSYVMSFWVDD